MTATDRFKTMMKRMMINEKKTEKLEQQLREANKKITELEINNNNIK